MSCTKEAVIYWAIAYESIWYMSIYKNISNSKSWIKVSEDEENSKKVANSVKVNKIDQV